MPSKCIHEAPSSYQLSGLPPGPALPPTTCVPLAVDEDEAAANALIQQQAEPCRHWAVLSPSLLKHAGAFSACQARSYWLQAK